MFKIMGNAAFLSYNVADREVKDEDFTEDINIEKSDENKASEF